MVTLISIYLPRYIPFPRNGLKASPKSPGVVKWGEGVVSRVNFNCRDLNKCIVRKGRTTHWQRRCIATMCLERCLLACLWCDIDSNEKKRDDPTASDGRSTLFDFENNSDTTRLN